MILRSISLLDDLDLSWKTAWSSSCFTPVGAVRFTRCSACFLCVGSFFLLLFVLSIPFLILALSLSLSPYLVVTQIQGRYK